MPLPVFPGIRYDPREPLPPGLNLGHINAHYKYPGNEGQKSGSLPPRVPRGNVNALHLSPEGGRGVAKVGTHSKQQLLEEGFLSPQLTSVKVQIIHDTAKFTIIQLFKNQSHDIKQGICQFPLPFDVTVTGFNCRIGPQKIIYGKVKARRQERAGGLMEQQTPEIFTITLANIPSRTKMQAELSFVCFLKQRIVADLHTFTLTLLTSIAPRYGDTWDDFIASHDNDAAHLRAATIKLKDRPTSLDKDIVITIDTALSDDLEAPQACLETSPTLENHQALMLTIPPELMTAAGKYSNDGEIIFLADRSGSMSDKIESLKSAMMFFINGIPMNRPFNIWCFRSDHTSLWPESKRLDKASREAAMAYVRQEFASNMGGTEILSAFQAICNSNKGRGAIDIIVLTDGEVWYPEQTVDFVRSQWVSSKGLVRSFPLGIGRGVSHELVEGIAKAGGGYAEVITSVSGGGWEDRVVAVLKAAITGHIGSLSMRLEWQEENNQHTHPEFKQSPNEILVISPFLWNRIFLLFDLGKQIPGLKHVILQVKELNGNTITKTLLPNRLHQPDDLIHKLAARALLGEIERGESWLHEDLHAYAYDPVIKEEAMKLGCKWLLVSKWTSIYAVEEETIVPDEAMEMEIDISVTADFLGDALLVPRGGQIAAIVASRLRRLRSDAEESVTESDDSEPKLDTCPVGQSATDKSLDGDIDCDLGFSGSYIDPRQWTGPASAICYYRHNSAYPGAYDAHFQQALQTYQHPMEHLDARHSDDWYGALSPDILKSPSVGVSTAIVGMVLRTLEYLYAGALAPIFNPPASTSLLQNSDQAAKAPDELAAEQFIARLLIV
ncbi:von Willebrand factor type A domain-containing protein [Dactylonectria estremocensis]|uniref:von Willebrand factor type A domain-containing protein n=1 Tax=Dactylonectria estremocensis TaxID=1079267 RepID=A0A9P9EQA8_9HYPO|nr:von Willebrand factor type A domain-containing protein [Dactylonectria estremocensis]